MARTWWGRATAALAFAVSTYLAMPAWAAGSGEAMLPRFAVLHADKVNLRAGPGDRYPIQWVYLRKDWPVEIIAHRFPLCRQAVRLVSRADGD